MNSSSQQKIRDFKRIRRSYLACWLLIICSLLSGASELWINDRPLVLYYQGKTFFPVFSTYLGADFGTESPLEPNYKELKLSEQDWALWPLIRWGSNESNDSLDSYPAPPNKDNWLGTDDRGRDLLTRLLYGFRVSLLFGLANLVLAVISATLIGGIQGFFGGWIDLVGQRLVEIWNALPYLYVLLLIVSLFEPSVIVLVVANGLFAWISLSYYIRAEYLKLRKRDFVAAATALGATSWRIVAKHIFPNSLIPVVTLAPFVVSLAITNLAILDYLGLGVPPPTASLGELLRQGREHFISSWWLAVYPFAALVGLTIALNFVGEGIREVFDPRRAK